MLCYIIEPAIRAIHPIRCETVKVALRVAELDPQQTDHSMITHSLGIIVHEFGMFVPPPLQSYFAIRRRLYAGNAVVYGFDRLGRSADAAELPGCHFLSTPDAVEAAILRGRVTRPLITINGEVIWRWPEPPP